MVATSSLGSCGELLRREKELDLLHLHTGKRLGGIIRSEAHRRKIPYVVSLHGGLTQRPISERLRQAAPTLGTLEYGKAIGWWVGSRKVISEASAVLCLSNEERDAVLQRYPWQTGPSGGPTESTRIVSPPGTGGDSASNKDWTLT